MVNNADLANSLGYDPANILLKQNGDVIEFVNGELQDTFEHIFVDDVLIDGNSSDDVGELVLKDREMLSSNGLVLISATLNKSTKELIIGPEVMTRGFLYDKDSTEIIDEIKNISVQTIEENVYNKYADYTKIRNDIRERISAYLYKETKCKPVILTVIQEVEE
jgi:ribonuclease J